MMNYFIFQWEALTCKYTTRSLNIGVLGDSERGTVCPNYPCCNGRLVRQICQLSYFCYILDIVPCTKKIKANSKIAVEKEQARIRLVVELATKTVQKIKDRCSYGWEVPGLNVRINLSISEILKLADHIIAKSKKVHDAIASVPLDKRVILPSGYLSKLQTVRPVGEGLSGNCGIKARPSGAARMELDTGA
ncbi:hypothetical protein OROMI_001552 [Orobanche minor]